MTVGHCVKVAFVILYIYHDNSGRAAKTNRITDAAQFSSSGQDSCSDWREDIGSVDRRGDTGEGGTGGLVPL